MRSQGSLRQKQLLQPLISLTLLAPLLTFSLARALLRENYCHRCIIHGGLALEGSGSVGKHGDSQVSAPSHSTQPPVHWGGGREGRLIYISSFLPV